ncbi:MAG: anaerobic ribonucleoside-triphosphate reductase activating protein [Candidatus Moraniibacteriota bacterium]|nr:MAG: anaerobic ribonucleoside-triphosphate reductase activating protein [Candidatus Moranbacteria bacterium]
MESYRVEYRNLRRRNTSKLQAHRIMYIAGYQPLTLLDYPGKLAATVFTLGCVLRCPFCHNPELIEPSKEYLAKTGGDKTDEFLNFLKKRGGKLDGICITGGEPTLHADLLDFIRKIKNMGFLVKLDTNGVFPNIVRKIAETKLVDFWAMDIKHTPEKYPLASGNTDIDISRFQESVRIIMESGADYEFRTTVVPGIHTEDDFQEIGKWIRGARHFALQEFRDIKLYDPTLAKSARNKSVDLNSARARLLPFIEHVDIRR